MNGMIKRQKITEREEFTYEEKLKISAKSDDRCCHCGKKVFIGYGATIEHFIPISQGGTNRDINMVMLCKECNETKDNFIYRPEDYLPYLKEKHMEKIKGYFDSYISSFDFINRDNLLACDRYQAMMDITPEHINNSLNYYKKNKKCNIKTKKKCLVPIWIKRARFEDTEKLTKYYIKYLKKYNSLDSEEAAMINIQFWLTFGCIYYIERNNDIESFITVSVTKSNGRVYLNQNNVEHFLTINVFTYYSNERALTIGFGLARQIPKYIQKEQNLLQMPVKYKVLNKDSLCIDICESGSIYQEGRFLTSFMILYDGEKEDLPKIGEDKNLNNFFNRFEEIQNEKLKDWFKMYKEEPYDWMIKELALDIEKKEEEE